MVLAVPLVVGLQTKLLLELLSPGRLAIGTREYVVLVLLLGLQLIMHVLLILLFTFTIITI